MTVWWIQFIAYINKWLPIFLTGYSTMRRIGVSAYSPPPKVPCLKGEWKIGTPHHFGTNKITTSFGRHKALEWWVKHCLQWESNPPTWGRTSHFLEILGGSQDLNLRDPFPNYQPRLPKAAGFPIEPPPTPDESSRECFRKKPRHWEVALKAGPFTEVQFGKLTKS